MLQTTSQVGQINQPPAEEREELALPDLNPYIERFSRHILAQRDAVEAFVREYIHLEHGEKLLEEETPRLVLTFLGPTGVGKTALFELGAAELLRSNPDLNRDRTAPDILRIDCGRFPSKSSLSDLVGSSTGYIGSTSDRGGYIEPKLAAENLERHAISYRKPDGRVEHVAFVLFDEIDRAGEELRNLLFSILDRGDLKMGGKEITYFGNTVVGFTSNLGASQVRATLHSMGFHQPSLESATRRQTYLDAFEREIDPGFVGRCGTKIVFDDLGPEEFPAILDAKLRDAEALFRRAGHAVSLVMTPEARNHIINMDAATDLGARPAVNNLRRNVIGHLPTLISAAHNHGIIIDLNQSTGQIKFTLDRGVTVQNSPEVEELAKVIPSGKLLQSRKAAFGLSEARESEATPHQKLIASALKIAGGAVTAGFGTWVMVGNFGSDLIKLPAAVAIALGVYSSLTGIVGLRRSAEE